MKKLLLITALTSSFIGLSFNEEAVEIEAGNCVIKGTLTTQDDPSKSTALIIFIAGSGPTDRDGNNPQMKNNSLKMVSDVLLENGYSTLRYDKRTIGESLCNPYDPKALTFDHFIEDAVAWVDEYAADARFHSIILAGHSQGSLVAMCAANQRAENVGGVISLAGAGKPIHKVLKWQLSATLSPEIQGVVDMKLDTLAGGDTLKHVPDYLNNLFHPTVQPLLISWMQYDPQEEASKLKCPLLIVNGTTDAQVTVEDAELLKEGNPKATYKIIKNMNHVFKFTKLKTGLEQLEIYGDPDIPLHKKLPGILLSWLEDING